MRILHALSGDTRYLNGIDFMEEEGGRSVCDLLDYMVNKGIQQGLQEGIQQGLQEGKQQGLQQGVRVLITTYKEFGITYEAAAAGVKEKYSLNDAEVQRDMELYW